MREIIKKVVEAAQRKEGSGRARRHVQWSRRAASPDKSYLPLSNE